MTHNNRNDRHIDLNKLEWEAARQSDLFKYWGDLWADACKRRDLLNERVKTVRSQIIEDLRKTWKDKGFDKPPTDTKMEAFYRTQEEYIVAKEEWIKADSDSRKLYIAMRSMEHKKDMINIEQRLYGGEYFSVPYTEPQFSKRIEDENKNESIRQLNKNEDTSRLGNRLIKRS